MKQIQSKNPYYTAFIEDWVTMRDTYRGERVVKDKGFVYLPATSGMEYDGIEPGQPGYKRYQAYKQRAVFPSFVKESVETMIGFLHNKPPTILLPAALEPLRERATPNGEGLEILLRRINENQLVLGRLGLLLDLPENPDPANTLPHIALYSAESIINWDEILVGAENTLGLNLVVLDESDFVRTEDFNWEHVEKYRVLLLDENLAYQQGVFSNRAGGLSFNQTSMIAPNIRGVALNKIPFAFINSKDIVAKPDDPPLLSLAKLCLAIYRGEADYRQSLFMQGQDTLVIIGSNDDQEEQRTGAGAVIRLRQGGDAKYIGVASAGLSEQRQALENDKILAQGQATQLVVNNKTNNQESGKALQVRLAAQTASLTQIALSGAAGLQQILRIAAEWVGANPEEVIVTPNLEFSSEPFTSRELVELMTAKTMGAPISSKSIHDVLFSKGMTKVEYEEELGLIEEEVILTERREDQQEEESEVEEEDNDAEEEEQ